MAIIIQNEHAIGGGALLASELTATDTNGVVTTAGGTCTTQQLLDATTNEVINSQPSYSGDSTTWDTTPTQNSTKPVTSGGVYSYIDTMITQAIADSY